jgi:hypothetical protein
MVLPCDHRSLAGGRFGEPWRVAPHRANGSAVGCGGPGPSSQRVEQMGRVAVVSLLAHDHDFHLAVPAGMGADCSGQFLSDGDCDDTHRWRRLNRRLDHLLPDQNHYELGNGDLVVSTLRGLTVADIPTQSVAGYCASVRVEAQLKLRPFKQSTDCQLRGRCVRCR